MEKSDRPTVAVVGSLNLDLVVPVPRRPAPGETVLGGSVARHPGGKGANQAVAAARLAQRVAMVGLVGDDDPGRALLASLQHDAVDTTFVRVTRPVPSGMALVTVTPDGENAIVVSPGANETLAPADVEAVEALLVDAAVTLLQLEVPLDTVTTAARVASGIVILNPAPAPVGPLPDALLEAVDVLVPNRSELAHLARAPEPTDVEEAGALAERLEAPGVVVTLGAAGAVVVERGRGTRTRRAHVPAPPVAAVDTTAAGDAFCGALADALARGSDLETAARWAVRVGALTVTRPGAQASLPYRHEVEAATRYRG